MKRNLIVIALVICGMLAFAGSSWALMAGSNNVGVVDSLIGQTTLADSGYATELAWLQSELGAGYTMFMKWDTESSDWLNVTGESNKYALDLQGTPEYYFLKLGNIDGTDRHFLFTNNNSLSWAVIDIAALGWTQTTGGKNPVTSIVDAGKVSHIGVIGGGGDNGCKGDCTTVSEPGMLLLFGSGLIGLGFFGRKKFSK